MASTSSNKMPLLVDRPLHSFANIGGAAALSTETNFNTVAGAGCTVLVDCSANDGAIIDSLSIIATETSTSAKYVLAFISTATTASAITFSIGDETAFGETFQNLITFSTGEPDFFVWNETDDSQTVTWKDVEPGSSD